MPIVAFFAAAHPADDCWLAVCAAVLGRYAADFIVRRPAIVGDRVFQQLHFATQ